MGCRHYGEADRRPGGCGAPTSPHGRSNGGSSERRQQEAAPWPLRLRLFPGGTIARPRWSTSRSRRGQRTSPCPSSPAAARWRQYCNCQP